MAMSKMLVDDVDVENIGNIEADDDDRDGDE